MMEEVPFLGHFHPSIADPADLVGREEDTAWLRGRLDHYLRGSAGSSGVAMALVGERGVGKSSVMGGVIASLKEHHFATTLFLVVDCRPARSQRDVYRTLATQLVEQLAIRGGVEEGLLDTARLLETLFIFETVARSTLAAHLRPYRAASKLSGGRSLLRSLGTRHGINLEQSAQASERLEGVLSFDAEYLRDAVVAFFSDIREHGYCVIVALDNLDELRHEAYLVERERDDLLADIDGILRLAAAPVGLVVTARTYFASMFNRWTESIRILRRMSDHDHEAIIRGRLSREAQSVREAFDAEALDACIERLAALAPTPLVLLSWFRFLAENERYQIEDTREALYPMVHARYANISAEVIAKIAALFANDPYTPRAREQLIAACGGNTSILNHILYLQIVLPLDFWNPYEFTLAPELHFLVQPTADVTRVPGRGADQSTASSQDPRSPVKLDRVQIAGFASIADAALELGSLTVLIGANGSGKSNLLRALRMLPWALAGMLQRFVHQAGGASSLLHYGPKHTPAMTLEAHFSGPTRRGVYTARLGFAADEGLLYLDEVVSESDADAQTTVTSLGAGHSESRLRDPPTRTDAIDLIRDGITGMAFFHFQDTSPGSALRTVAIAEDDRELRADGGNLAAYLARLERSSNDAAQKAWWRINRYVGQIAPSVKKLCPTPTTTENTKIRLDWLDDRGERFGVHQLSDGTLRAIALITALARPMDELPQFICIDEPELGLHPAAIHLVAELARAATRHAQVMFATQSTTFLDHFDPDEIVVVDRATGASTFRRLDGSALDGWLEDYSLSEIFDKGVIGGRP